jgi:hypothetical protein
MATNVNFQVKNGLTIGGGGGGGYSVGIGGSGGSGIIIIRYLI